MRPIYRLGMGLVLMGLTVYPVLADQPPHNSKHQHVEGVVVEKGGALAVKVPNGTTYQLNEKRSERHGHAVPKVGDRVMVEIDENNMVLEIHPKGTEGQHKFVTGEVLSIDVLKHELTLKTAKGEQQMQLEKQEMPASIQKGVMVTAEVNEAGSVIDLHPADKRK